MQLIIEHDVKGPLVLPINYLHILQSAVYASLADDREYASQLHDMQNRGNLRSKIKISYSGIIFCLKSAVSRLILLTG